jgi:hypothetical protein
VIVGKPLDIHCGFKSRDLEVNGRIMLKWIVRKCESMWIRFIWFTIGSFVVALFTE